MPPWTFSGGIYTISGTYHHHHHHPPIIICISDMNSHLAPPTKQFLTAAPSRIFTDFKHDEIRRVIFSWSTGESEYSHTHTLARKLSHAHTDSKRLLYKLHRHAGFPRLHVRCLLFMWNYWYIRLFIFVAIVWCEKLFSATGFGAELSALFSCILAGI